MPEYTLPEKNDMSACPDFDYTRFVADNLLINRSHTLRHDHRGRRTRRDSDGIRQTVD